MKTLIYVGANLGYGLIKILQKESFDKIYVFEPNIEIFQQLKNNLKNFSEKIIFVQAACSSIPGIKNLFITPNIVSSSLGEVNIKLFDKFIHSGGSKSIKTIPVLCLNLNDFLKSQQIDTIDFLVLDCQGSDFEILSTLQEYIKYKKINKIFCETHSDGINLYDGLDNSFSNYKRLLDENYLISFFSYDGLITDNPFDKEEWDTCWQVKD